jgi:hypothetical protein
LPFREALGRKRFFFEKKEPKNFCDWRRARVVQKTPRGGGGKKSLLLLFFREEGLPFPSG